MNYGKRGMTSRAGRMNARGQKIKNKIVCTIALLALLCAGTVGAVGICAGLGVWKGIIDTAPDMSSSDAAPAGYYSTVFANDGETVLTTLVASGANRKHVRIEDTPLYLQHAFVAIEDDRFYQHNGIDLYSIFRAGISGVNNAIKGGNFDQGGSTITQQLIKNNVLTGWTAETTFIEKLQRKLQEQYLAVELEKSVSKNWILENYMNTINLGANTLGIQSASQRYFGKEVGELTLSECAVIAGISQNPTAYNPIVYPENNEIRREKVLSNMLEQGYITQAEYDSAMADTAVYERIALHTSQDSTNYNGYDSFFVDALIDNVYQDLVAAGYSEKEATKLIYEGGLSIISSQDLALQQICDEEVNNLDNYDATTSYSFDLYFQIETDDGNVQGFTNNSMLVYLRGYYGDDEYSLNYPTDDACFEAISKYEADMLALTGGHLVEGSEMISINLEPQVALTLMDPATGLVKAIIGGRGEKIGNRNWNRATDTLNQPGSTFKILSTYAPALDTGLKTLASTQMDEYYEVGKWYVRDNEKTYYDNTNIREGITHSINVAAVKTMQDIGLDLSWKYLTDPKSGFGFTTLNPDSDKNLPLALGGIGEGVNNVELAAAFAAIANHGEYRAPKFYTKVLDKDGHVILDVSTSQEVHQVVSPQTAYLLTSAMQDVMLQGSGRTAYFSKEYEQAGKTGTTDKVRDILFAGYSPYYLCTIWGGYDDNTAQKKGGYGQLIWRAIMRRTHQGLEPKNFDVPDGIVQLKVCRDTGLLAQDGVCGNSYLEYFDEKYVPQETCSGHVQLTVCEDSGMLPNGYCEHTITKVFDRGTQPTERCTYHYSPYNDMEEEDLE